MVFAVTATHQRIKNDIMFLKAAEMKLLIKSWFVMIRQAGEVHRVAYR